MDSIEIPIYLVALIAVVLPNIGGLLGGLITVKNIEWYESLVLPDWRPPNWLFGPMWTILYCAIGLASFLVLQAGGELGTATIPLLAYAVNLLLNWAWTPIFFGLHYIKLGLLEILLIDLTAIITCVLFYLVSKIAGLLLVPYVIWLTIATALNLSIVINNPNVKKNQ